jgi:hypothetical protein
MSDFGDYQLDKIEANVVPKGEYPVVVVTMEKKPTKDGTGERLNIQLKIAGGPMVNRTLFDGLNVKNKNAIAQNISRAHLKALCIAACGKPDVGIKDIIDATMRKAIIAVVDIKDDQNVIKKYKAREVAQAAAPAPQQKQPNLIEQAFEPEPETAGVAKPPGW